MFTEPVATGPGHGRRIPFPHVRRVRRGIGPGDAAALGPPIAPPSCLLPGLRWSNNLALPEGHVDKAILDTDCHFMEAALGLGALADHARCGVLEPPRPTRLEPA